MKIMLFIFLAFTAFLALRFRIYGANRKGWKLFCLRMVKDPVYRELFGKKVLVFMLLFHFVYQTIFGFQTGIIISMTLTCLMFSKKLQELIFCFFADSKKAMLVLFLITLSTSFVPKLYPVAFSCATILISSIFYPHKIVRDKDSPDSEPQELDFIVENYF